MVSKLEKMKKESEQMKKDLRHMDSSFRITEAGRLGLL